jgi:hypothetical protein
MFLQNAGIYLHMCTVSKPMRIHRPPHSVNSLFSLLSSAYVCCLLVIRSRFPQDETGHSLPTREETGGTLLCSPTFRRDCSVQDLCLIHKNQFTVQTTFAH